MQILRMLEILFAIQQEGENTMGCPLKCFDVDKSSRSLKIRPSKANDLNLYILKRIYYENK